MSEMKLEIEALRRELGGEVLILGHHYQRPEVLRHADFKGDSLELARKAAASGAERILFCGVRFMAESADILSSSSQAVYLSEASAGCPMAEMADVRSAERAWDRLRRLHGKWAPVVYVNSTAEVKAFCGRRGGSACTSSNCARVMSHFLDQGQRIFFLPDEHLAANTAHDLGIADEDVVRYDPAMEDGGLSDEVASKARVVVWKGYCHVHTNFTTQQVRAVRESLPEAKIIVHPESPKAVVRAADAHGSTAQIIRYVEHCADGSTVVVGTERQLVMRLAEEQKGRVRVLALLSSSCPNMARTTESAVLEVLRDWPVSTRVSVPEDVAMDARVCLERMLAL